MGKQNVENNKKVKSKLDPRKFSKKSDIEIFTPDENKLLGGDRLLFDGYKLYWQGEKPESFDAFSGDKDERYKESKKDLGPTPQGLYSVTPSDIEEWDENDDDWGKFRIKIDPYKATSKRMINCFKLYRTDMFIHGGTIKGTKGCIEINDDGEEKKFIKRLKKYNKKIELEVKYTGEREKKYEVKSCPY